MAKDYHNNGQEDASKEKYDPPGGNSIFNDVIEIIAPPSDKETEQRKDYSAGWRHAKDQKKKD